MVKIPPSMGIYYGDIFSVLYDLLCNFKQYFNLNQKEINKNLILN